MSANSILFFILIISLYCIHFPKIFAFQLSNEKGKNVNKFNEGIQSENGHFYGGFINASGNLQNYPSKIQKLNMHCSEESMSWMGAQMAINSNYWPIDNIDPYCPNEIEFIPPFPHQMPIPSFYPSPYSVPKWPMTKQNMQNEDQYWGCTSLDCSLNMAINPCEDFYEFVCSGFNKNVGSSPNGLKNQFDILMIENYKNLIELLNSPGIRQKYGRHPFISQMFTFYDSCQNDWKREMDKSDGLFAHLGASNFDANKIHSFDTNWLLNAFPFVPFFDIQNIFDIRKKTTTKNMFVFMPGSILTTKLELKSEESRGKFAEKLTKILRFILADQMAKRNEGPLFFRRQFNSAQYEAEIQRRVQNLIQIELMINKTIESHMGGDDPIDLDGYGKNFEKHSELYLTIGELRQQFSPSIDWLQVLWKYYPNVGEPPLTESTKVHVIGHKLLIAFGQIVESLRRQNPQMLSDYLDWTLIWPILPHLDSRFEELMDAKQQKNYYNCTVKYAGVYFVHWLDRIYVENVFDKSLIAGNKRILGYLKRSFSVILNEAKWMDPISIQKAQQKLAQMKMLIGYVKLIEDEEFLQIIYRGYRIHGRMPWAQMYAEVFRNSYLMPWREYRPSYVPNGHNSWPSNTLLINAGIIQPPWYNPSQNPVVNFGSMGTFMGHEITHGFDSKGRHFDGQGNKLGENDLDKGTTERMERKMDCFVEQYGRYEGEAKRQNPRFTLSENIADNGGIRASFKAWKMFEKENPAEINWAIKNANRWVAHFNNEQIFFISSAFTYCSAIPENDKNYAKTDNHAFPRARVNLPLRNFEAFAKAFQCPIGSKMNPNEAERCQLW